MTLWLQKFLGKFGDRHALNEWALCERDCRIDDCKLYSLKLCKRRIAGFEQLSRISDSGAKLH
ncbi:MAG: hypothetical protein HY244_14040 [Rhizobiales bacterium]|nr:hypothetical protein [Hyphomicrobiales bacterium]